MAATLSVRPNRFTAGSPYPSPPSLRRRPDHAGGSIRNELWRGLSTPSIILSRRKLVQAGSRADDSAPSDMSVENALKLLGVTDGASFDDILRAKNSILATCKDDQEAIAQVRSEPRCRCRDGEELQLMRTGDSREYRLSGGLQVEAAYDMLLMQSLTQRRAGRVVSSKIRYADVKPANAPGMGSMPQWLQASVKNAPVSVETPSSGELGIQAGVYGALMILTYVNGASTSPTVPYAGADVPGLILASSFGASLYFMTKKNVKLGKATLITLGGLVAGAVVGSAVENWLQVDIVPFLGIHSPAAVISEFILFSQLLVSLYLR